VYLSNTFSFANLCWKLGFGPNETGDEYGFIISLQSVLEDGSPPLPVRTVFRMHHPLKSPYDRARDEPFIFEPNSMKSRGFLQ
jgi:hypothetical protein